MFTVPSQPPQPSGRKGSKKVRTGCITCKIRKVKCDEAKPHCLRCLKTGRKCDGYRQSPNSSPEPSSLIPAPGFESQEAVRAFDFYRRRTSKVLSGAVADTGFWAGLVVKMSASEPAVRHAMLAIASLHECVDAKARRGRRLDTRFAFREYGNAITSLRTWAQRDEPSVVPLLVCLLFICIEFLADRDMACQMHICQGRKILSNLGDGRSPAMETVKHSLVPIYTRLSLASFLFGSRPAEIPPHLRTWAEVPAVFATVDEARTALYLIVDEGLQFGVKAHAVAYNPNPDPEVAQALLAKQGRLITQLNRWNAAFTVLTSMSAQSPALETSLNMLRLYYQSSLVWMSTALQPYELANDAHINTFASIVSLASTIIGSVPSNAMMESFTFETEVVPPVYWAAIKCRHPLLRRAALKLLTRDQMRDRRENLWHARETSIIAARIIEMEESDLESSPLDISMDTSLDLDTSGSSSLTDELGTWNSYTCSARKIKVDVSKQPTLPPPKPSFTDPNPEDGLPGTTPGSAASSNSSPGPATEPKSPISAALEGIQNLDIRSASLEAPYGIPENKRVKNTLIGPAEEGGIWVTFFRDPDPGETQWKVTREFLRC